MLISRYWYLKIRMRHHHFKNLFFTEPLQEKKLTQMLQTLKCCDRKVENAKVHYSKLKLTINIVEVNFKKNGNHITAKARFIRFSLQKSDGRTPKVSLLYVIFSVCIYTFRIINFVKNKIIIKHLFSLFRLTISHRNSTTVQTLVRKIHTKLFKKWCILPVNVSIKTEVCSNFFCQQF
ncbi:Protein of unknown function [Gryllus bimaculatus]|nr:Protein of unknown function [Gryllus bimaculatus]